MPLTVRPDDRDALRAAVRDVHAGSGLEVSFGGLVPRAGRTALAVRDEVDRRLAVLTGASPDPGASGWEEVRAVHADLRLLAQASTDATVRDRLLSACGRLASAHAGPDADPAVRLSARELDVLALVALGCSNREAAGRLSLRPETVKSYLAAAMAKLDAHTRLEAVVTARRLGLLP